MVFYKILMHCYYYLRLFNENLALKGLKTRKKAL
jgi:hypothetical protein